MPRKKAEKKIKAPVLEEVPVPTTSADYPPEHETPVVYEGAEVISILEVKADAYHCKMNDGTTKWIPKEVFEKK
jgi:hypothetical protein